MALRSPALWMGNPAVQHTAQNDRLMLAGLHRPEPGSTAANRPLTATSGVIAGPPGTMGEVTLLSNTQFTVNPARWVIYSSASALGGTYKVVNDAVETLGITAQNASQYRRSYFGVWVIDSFVAGAGDDLPHWGVVDGALAASAGVAALPSAGSLPANFLALGEFLIPPVGQAVTYTPYDVRTGLRGGILPVSATDTRNGASVDQYRGHPTYGLERWDGTKWSTPAPLGQWGYDLDNTTFSSPLTTAAGTIPPGHGPFTVAVPPGRSLEVEWSAGQLNFPGAGGTAYITLWMSTGAGGMQSQDGGMWTLSGVNVPARLSASWTNTGSTTVNVGFQVTAFTAAGGGGVVINAGTAAGGRVRLRHRIV